jgi:protein O-mannosyl-transferase
MYIVPCQRFAKKMNKNPKTISIIAISLAIVTFTVYLPALWNQFLYWDDNLYVYENYFIRSIDAQLFKLSFLGFHASNWHPLTWLSHAADYSLWGLDPLGHHLSNNILHAFNTLVVVILIFKLLSVYKERTIALRETTLLDDQRMLIAAGVTGLLFGLHPIHVESVAWVAERKDLLCALFFLLSILSYVKCPNAADHNDQKTFKSIYRDRHYLLALIFFTLALLSKPMAVTLPVVLLILDWCVTKRIRSVKSLRTAVTEKIPFIALSLISSILTVLAQKAGGAMLMTEIVPLSVRLLVAVRSLMMYLWKMLVPVDLLPYYTYPKDVSLFSPEYIAVVVLGVVTTIACVVLAKKQKVLLSAWGYYVITLIPVLGIIQVGAQSMADRYTYLPSLGPFLIVGLITANTYGTVINASRWREISRPAFIFIALAIIVSLSYATIKQIGIWKNSIVFWNYVIEKEPSRVPIAHYNLGFVYKNQGLLDKAIEQYRLVISIKRDYAEAYNNLGIIYKNQGLFDLAIEQYRMALSIKGDYAEAHNNLGIAYSRKGLYDLAIEQYRIALSMRPDDAEAHFNLGRAYLSKGSKDLARSEFELGLKAKPDDYRARQILNSMISK